MMDRKAIFGAIAILGVTGCAQPAIVSASSDEIAYSVLATPRQHGAAGEMAAAHCAQFGRSASLDNISASGTSGSLVPTAYGPVGSVSSTAVLKFRCR